MALFDPREKITLNPSCRNPHSDIDGLKSISENTLICYLDLDLAIMLFVVESVFYMIYATLYSFVLTPLVFSKKDQGGKDCYFFVYSKKNEYRKISTG